MEKYVPFDLSPEQRFFHKKESAPSLGTNNSGQNYNLVPRVLSLARERTLGTRLPEFRPTVYFVRFCPSPLAMHIEEHLKDLNLTVFAPVDKHKTLYQPRSQIQTAKCHIQVLSIPAVRGSFTGSYPFRFDERLTLYRETTPWLSLSDRSLHQTDKEPGSTNTPILALVSHT